MDSVTSSLGQVIENKQILDLPLNGRNPFALGLLSGNTTPMFGMGSNLPFIAGGGRFSANEVTLDGVDNNTVSNAGSIGRNGIAVVPSVDAVQEFKVKTSTFSAEFGHAAGAVVNATIKSGTNQFHGTVFEFLRNDDLDANNFFTNAAGLPRAPFHQNQFGGAVGGPIIHNRTFFFADYQGTRQATSAGSSITRRAAGGFAQRRFFEGRRRRSTIPTRARSARTAWLSRTPFPGNIIPQNRLNATCRRHCRAGSAAEFRRARRALPQLLLPAGAVLEHGPGRYSRRPDHLRQEQSLRPLLHLQQFAARRWAVSRASSAADFVASTTAEQAVLSDIHIFTPSLVNEFRFGFIRHNGSFFGNRAGRRRLRAAAQSGDCFRRRCSGFPSIAFIYSGTVPARRSSPAGAAAIPNLNVENRFQWADNLSWTHGTHAVKFGADIRRQRFDALKGRRSSAGDLRRHLHFQLECARVRPAVSPIFCSDTRASSRARRCSTGAASAPSMPAASCRTIGRSPAGSR